MFFHGGYPPVIKRRNETSPLNGDVYGKNIYKWWTFHCHGLPKDA